MDREPAILIAGLVAVFDASVAAAAYGFGWSGEATALIMGVVAAVASLVGAWFGVRPRVTPV